MKIGRTKRFTRIYSFRENIWDAQNKQFSLPIPIFPPFFCPLIFHKNELQLPKLKRRTIRFCIREDTTMGRNIYGPVEISISKGNPMYPSPFWQFYTWNNPRYPSKDVRILVSKDGTNSSLLVLFLFIRNIKSRGRKSS